jgi:hypothetical protein
MFTSTKENDMKAIKRNNPVGQKDRKVMVTGVKMKQARNGNKRIKLIKLKRKLRK